MPRIIYSVAVIALGTAGRNMEVVTLYDRMTALQVRNSLHIETLLGVYFYLSKYVFMLFRVGCTCSRFPFHYSNHE